jgi:hypothetical protein
MALRLCPTCRLPVNGTRVRCPECASLVTSVAVTRSVPVAALLAVFATLAVLTRRFA